MKEQVIWANKVGSESWKSEVIYSGPQLSKEDLTKCLDWCDENNFDRVRLSSLDLSTAPNFGAELLNA